ncbi:hypothetical protein GOODEAATRI_026845, partial [Goodea atripinnis]
GKFWQTMGFSAEGKQYLLPEEALYLMEFTGARGETAEEETQPQPDTNMQTTGESLAEKMEGDDKLPESHLMTSAEPPEPQTASPHCAAKGQARTWWMMDAPELEADKRSSPGSPSGRLRWNFSTIPFPDLGSTSRPRCMVPVDPSLLPRDVTVGVCDLDSWMRKINLRKVKMSVKEQQREKRRRRWDVNKDREVKSPKGRNKAEAFSVSVDLILRSVRFKGAETGRSTMSCWPGGRRSGKADQLTCGTGKLNLYTTRLSQSPPVSWCWTRIVI